MSESNKSKTAGCLSFIVFLFIIGSIVSLFKGGGDDEEAKEQVKMAGNKIFATHVLEVGAYQEEEVERIGRKVYRIAKENIKAKEYNE